MFKSLLLAASLLAANGALAARPGASAPTTKSVNFMGIMKVSMTSTVKNVKQVGSDATFQGVQENALKVDLGSKASGKTIQAYVSQVVGGVRKGQMVTLYKGKNGLFYQTVANKVTAPEAAFQIPGALASGQQIAVKYTDSAGKTQWISNKNDSKNPAGNIPLE